MINTYVELFCFRSGRISLPDPEPARRLLEPWIVQPVQDWSWVDLACEDGGANVQGLERPASLGLNQVEGRQIWDVIYRLCDGVGLAASITAERYLVTSTSTLEQLPKRSRAGSMVCADGDDLRNRHEEAWQPMVQGEVAGDEVSEPSIYDENGNRIQGWVPGIQQLLEQRAGGDLAARVPYVDGRQADFVTLSMVGRLWGNFSTADRQFPVPDGLDEAFGDWMTSMWRLWSEGGDWETAIEALVPFDGLLTPQSPSAMSLAFDLAARFQPAVEPTERMTVSMIHLLDQLRPRTDGAADLVGPLTDSLVLDLVAHDLEQARRTLTGDLHLIAHQAATTRDHQLLFRLATNLDDACRSHPDGPALREKITQLVDETSHSLTT